MAGNPTFDTGKVFEVNIGVWRSMSGHVGTVEDDRDHVGVENFPELFSHIIFTEGVFQREIKLRNRGYISKFTQFKKQLQTKWTLWSLNFGC